MKGVSRAPLAETLKFEPPCAGGQGIELTKPDLKEYVSRLLDFYLHTPGTLGRVRREDRHFAAGLHARGVPLRAVEEALLLASARRCLRAPDAPPLNAIRSLHYFGSVIEEVSDKPLPAGYPEYFRQKLRGRITSRPQFLDCRSDWTRCFRPSNIVL